MHSFAASAANAKQDELPSVQANRKSIIRHILAPLTKITRFDDWHQPIAEVNVRLNCLCEAYAESLKNLTTTLATLESENRRLREEVERLTLEGRPG